MRLDVYLISVGKTVAAAAEELGYGHETVRMWVRGKRIPRAAAMADIKRWSCDKVTATDFYPVNEPDETVPSASAAAQPQHAVPAAGAEHHG